MRITHVIRGDDHVNNTPRQINIIRALGAEPPVYAHVPTVLGEDGAEALQAPRRGQRDAVRGAGLPAGGDGQFPRPARLGARRRRGVHARAVRRLVRPRRDQPRAVAVQRRQAEVAEPGAHEAAARGRARTRGSCRTSMRAGLDPAAGPAPGAVGVLLRDRVATLAEMADAAHYFYATPQSVAGAAGRARQRRRIAPRWRSSRRSSRRSPGRARRSAPR